MSAFVGVFVGDAALGVPLERIMFLARDAEGGVPYRTRFLLQFMKIKLLRAIRR